MMMNPQEFEKQWLSMPDEKLNKFDIQLFKPYRVDNSTLEFLTTSGLPDTAAPYLNFGPDYFQEFNRLLIIGVQGQGDLIGISPEKSDKVYATSVQGGRPYFVNSSVQQLASFLLIYRAFVTHIISERGEDAWINCDFTKDEFELMEAKFIEVDEDALELNTLWNEDLGILVNNMK